MIYPITQFGTSVTWRATAGASVALRQMRDAANGPGASTGAGDVEGHSPSESGEPRTLQVTA